MPFQKSGSFVAVAGEIRSTCGVLQQPRRLIATLHQSLALSLRRIPVEDQSTAQRQIMFFKVKEMLKKAREPKHDGHPTILARWYAQASYRDASAKHNIGEKEIMHYGRIALERHDFTATRAERLQNAKHFVLRLNAGGPKCLFDSDQNLSMHWNKAWKCKMLTWRKRNNLWDRHVQNINNVNDWISNLKEEKTSITTLIENLDGGYREPRRNPQAASSSSTSQWPMANELELVAAYIISERVVISVSWKEVQKIDGCRQDTHSQCTSVQYSLFTSAERTSRAWLKSQHGSSNTDCSVIFARL